MTNISKRSNGIYYAEVAVPARIRSVVGKRKLIRSLKTRNRRTAVVEAAPILKGFYALLEAAERDPDAYADVLARGFVEEYETPRDEPRDEGGYTRAERNLEGFLDTLPDNVRQRYQRGVAFLSFLSAFEDQYDNHKTVLEARRYLTELADYVPTLSSRDLKPANVRRWLDSETNKQAPRAVKTLQKAAGFGSEYFLWCVHKGYVPDGVDNPFKGLRYPKSLKSKDSYVALSLPEIMALRAAAEIKGDTELVWFIDVARYTGMRISEIAALSADSLVVVESVECFRVRPDAKTKASSNRLVPVCESLRKAMGDSWPSGANRADPVSKRFGRLKRDLLPDGASRTKVFHSIRKFVATTLEQAGVPEGIAADLVGHEKQTMTYGVYSGGSALKQLAGAVRKLEAAQK